MSSRTRTSAVVSGVAAALLLLSACGGDTESNGETGVLVDPELSNEELVTLAEAEGKVTFYTTVAGPTAETLSAAFEAKYPGVTVEIFTGNIDVLASKIASEAQAGQVTADVIEADNFGLQQMREQDLIQPFYSPSAQDFPEETRTSAEDEGTDYYVSDRVLYISAGFNPEAIGDAEIDELDDLLDPELKDRMAFAQGTTAARWVGAVMHELGEEDGEEFIRDLGAQNVKLAPVTTAALADLIVAGQYAITPSLLSNAPVQRPGAPLEWKAIGTAVASTGSVAVAADAPNEAAARLFADFLLSADGQALYVENGYASPGEEADFDTWDPLETYTTTQEFNEAYEGWQALLDEYVY